MLERKGHGEILCCVIEKRRQTSGKSLQWFDKLDGTVRRAFSTRELKLPNESTGAPTDDDVGVLLEFDRTDDGFVSFRIPVRAPRVSSQASHIDWKQQTDDPVLSIDRNAPGTLCALFRCKMVVRELGLYVCDSLLVFSGSHEQAVVKQRRLCWILSSLLRHIKWPTGRFPTIDSKCAWRISAFGTERISFFLSVSCNDLSNVLWLTRRANTVLFALFIKESIL